MHACMHKFMVHTCRHTCIHILYMQTSNSFQGKTSHFGLCIQTTRWSLAEEDRFGRGDFGLSWPMRCLYWSRRVTNSVLLGHYRFETKWDLLWAVHRVGVTLRTSSDVSKAHISPLDVSLPLRDFPSGGFNECSSVPRDLLLALSRRILN